MSENIDSPEIKQAKSAHQLFMMGLGSVLVIGPLMIFIEIGRIGILAPVMLSLVFALFSYNKFKHEQNEFVKLHWLYALKNYRWLFAGYLLSAILLSISWMLQTGSAAHSPGQLLSVALIRIGIMPAIIMVFVSFVIGNNALNQAMQHKVPTTLKKQTY